MKAFDILSTEDRSEFEALLRVPATTVDKAFEWMTERGYTISRGAVHNAKRSFTEVLESVKRSSEMAAQFTAMARGNTAEMGEAALGRFQQLLMAKLMEMSTNEDLDPGDLRKLASALNMSSNAGERIENLKAEFAKKQAAAIAEASKAVGKGASAADVVATIKRSLGIAA